MTLTEFQQWLFAAEPRESLTYYVGNLVADREHNSELNALAREVKVASDAGFVELKQLRLSVQLYVYLATRSEEIVG